MRPRIDVFADAATLADAACTRVVSFIEQAVAARGRCVIALSGGSTPKALYTRLAAHPELPWNRVELCFGDERPVPPDHEQSNARMVREALTHLPFVPATHVHRIAGELPGQEAALDYESVLRRLFPDQDLPRFDLVLLGLGSDGHTASLFPHTSALGERQAWVVSHWVEAQQSQRISLTFPVLNAARLCLFLVTGADKREALHAVLEGTASIIEVPAKGIRPAQGELEFMIDEAAASLLSPALRDATNA
ncbi:MAG: 6-phosphogluconolactonase [Myxococcales bacterium]